MRTVALAPNEPAAHVLVAELAYPAPDVINPRGLDIAEQALQHALRLDPQSSAAMNDLARVRLRRSQRVGAMTGFSDALTADPQNATALGNVHVLLSGYLLHAYRLVLAATLVSLPATSTEAGGGGRLFQGVVDVVVLGVIGGVVLRLRRGLGGRLVPFLRESVRRSRFGGACGATIAVVVACLTVGPLLPQPAREPLGRTALLLVLAPSAAGIIRVAVALWRTRRRGSPLQ